ncbi:MAG TPA: EamA family transporter [Thiobacillus sp.]
MHASTNSSIWLNTLVTALAPAIWGSTYIVTTEFLPPDRPFIAALLRTLPAGILLAAFCWKTPQRAEWGRLLILSALNIGFFQALLFVAAYRLPGGVAAVVGAIQPLMVMGLIWMLDKNQPSYLALVASVLGITGMAALLLSPGAAWDGIGIVAALAGAACMAAGTFLARRWQPKVSVMVFTSWQLLAGGLMLVPVAWLVDPPLPVLTSIQILSYAYLSIIGTLLAYVLWFRGLARLSPVAVSSLGLLSPLTAVLLGWFFLDQTLTGLSLIGLMTVLASVLGVQWASRSPQSLTQPASPSVPSC